MKYKSEVFSQASGSIAGMTFSRNRGGLYVRARAMPTNPNTLKQQAMRSYLATLNQTWVSVLTQGERDAWEDYAVDVLLPDSLGEMRRVSGLNHFIRSNAPRMQASLATVTAPPAIHAVADLTTPGFTIVNSSPQIVVTFTNTDLWATAVGGALLVWASAPVNASVNFFKGPYQYRGKIAGAVVPPTSPANITYSNTMAAGQKVFVKVAATNDDGRYSSPFRRGVTVG